jgi:hypothetical protein
MVRPQAAMAVAAVLALERHPCGDGESSGAAADAHRQGQRRRPGGREALAAVW